MNNRATIGKCECCLCPLFKGDQGYLDPDTGNLFCSKHSPTYEDLEISSNVVPLNSEIAQGFELMRALIASHIEAGGKMTDPYTAPL